MSYYSDNQKDSLRAIGGRIRELREKKGTAQDELASFMGAQRSTVAKWENGAQDFKSEAIDRMARYFECSIDYLLRGASAETYDIYIKTGLTDTAVEKLDSHNNGAERDFSDGKPISIDMLNELLSDNEFYRLLSDFLSLREEWRSINEEIKAQEKAAKTAEPRSRERREATGRIRESNERAEFLLWKYEHSLGAYIRKLLEVR